MKKLFDKIKLLALLCLGVIVAGCSTTAYQQGVQATVTTNTQYMNIQQEQLGAIQICYMYSKNTAECSVALAGLSTVQVLGGRPAPIRIAKSPEEILETIADKGFDTAVKIYGIKQIGEVLKGSIDEAGKVEIVKPEVVRPEIVRPEVFFGAPASPVN